MSVPLHQMRTGHGSYKTEIIIVLRKGRRTSPMMNTDKENVSPSVRSPVLVENDLDCLSESLHKGLDLNGLGEKDGRYFLDAMKKETDRLNRLCETCDRDVGESTATEEVRGKVRATIGKSKLLTTKKFKQFKGLCEFNLGIGETNGIRPTNGDLAGFWDMVMLQVEDVTSMFEKLDELKKNGWEETRQPLENGEGLTRKPSLTKKSSLTRQSSFGKVPLTRQRSREEIKQVEAKQRAAARQRLAAAKRAARNKLNRNSNPLDNVEIYCSPHK